MSSRIDQFLHSIKVVIPLCFMVLLSTVYARAATWIVDDNGGPGVDFTDIQPAIDAASWGDRIIVRDGTYSRIVIDKVLRLVSDTGHVPYVDDYHNEIRNIGPGQRVIVSGFAIKQMDILNCQGSITVDLCNFGKTYSMPTLEVSNCDLVNLSRIHAESGVNADYSPTNHAVRIEDSKVILSECDLEGGNGLEEWCDDAYPGTKGIVATNSTLYVQSSFVRGGNGGYVYGIEPYGYGGDGAPAIDVSNCHVELFGLSIHQITGGYGGSGYSGDGYDANAVVAVNSDVIYSGVTFITYGGKPAFKGGNITEVDPDVPVILLSGAGELKTTMRPCLYGPVNAYYILFYSFSPSLIPVTYLYTDFLVDPSTLIVKSAGVIPAQGYVTTQLYIPDQAKYQGKSAFFQAYLETDLGVPYLSTSAGFVAR